jgi:predicted metal-dependent phosphoesterase TrpH
MWIREADMQPFLEQLILECQIVATAYERDRTHEQLRRLYEQHLQLRQQSHRQFPSHAVTAPHPFDGFRRDLLLQFLEVLDKHLTLVEELAALQRQLRRCS